MAAQAAMEGAMHDFYISELIARAAAAVFAAGALLNLAGLGFVRRAYARWGYPPKFYRVVGVLELTVAAFLALPLTRIWGVALGEFIVFAAVVTLLKNRQYAQTIPGIILLIALVPAVVAGPL